MAKRRTSRKRKPRKAAPRRRASFKARKPMARKAPKRRKSRTTKAAPRRRSYARRRSGGVVGLVMPLVLGAGGYFAGEYLIPKLLKGQSALVRGGVGAGAAIGLAMFMPAAMPVAVGLGIQGLVSVGRDVLKLPAPSGGIRGLSDGQRRALARMADSGMVNGRDSKFINGARGQAASMLNGVDGRYQGGEDIDRSYR